MQRSGPISPQATIADRASNAGWWRSRWPIMNTRSERATWAARSSASARSEARGFSTKTSLPCSRARRQRAAWAGAGAAMIHRVQARIVQGLRPWTGRGHSRRKPRAERRRCRCRSPRPARPARRGSDQVAAPRAAARPRRSGSSRPRRRRGAREPMQGQVGVVGGGADEAQSMIEALGPGLSRATCRVSGVPAAVASSIRARRIASPMPWSRRSGIRAMSIRRTASASRSVRQPPDRRGVHRDDLEPGARIGQAIALGLGVELLLHDLGQHLGGQGHPVPSRTARGAEQRQAEGRVGLDLGTQGEADRRGGACVAKLASSGRDATGSSRSGGEVVIMAALRF